MFYPTVNIENTTRDMIDTFGGYNHNLRINDNEFYDMENMTSSLYPVLAPRVKRGEPVFKVDELLSDIRGMLYKSDFYHAISQNGELLIYKNGTTSYRLQETSVSEDVKRQLIMMGAYIIVLPDKQYFNTANPDDKGYIEQEYTSEGKVTFQACRSNGEVYGINYVGDTEPKNICDDYVWLDTSVSPASLKYYVASNSCWYGFTSTLVKIGAKGIGAHFKSGDGITLKGVVNLNIEDLNTTTIIKEIPDDDSIIVVGLISTMESEFVLTACKDYTSDVTQVAAYCDENFEENALAGKYIHIGNKVGYVTNNSVSKKEIGYEIDESGFTEDVPVIYIYRAISNSKTIQVSDINSSQEYYTFYDSLKIGNFIKIGDNEEVYKIQGFKRGNSGEVYITVDRTVDASAMTIVYPMKECYTGKYYTLLTLYKGKNISKGEKICPTIESQYMQDEVITLSRKMPEMDYVIENKNRLWGCRYGTDANGNNVNEIYASKLGDFKNWNCFEGISTDSYVASLGTDGAFTGAVSYQGYPLFFKENYLHTVYGNYPSQYQINDMACRGAQKGSEQSIAQVNEVLYYKSATGVMAYSGTTPTEISYALGDKVYKNIIACAYKGKYYASATDVETNTNVLLVYDTKRGMWHKESGIQAVSLCAVENDVYYLTPEYNLKSLFGSGKKDSEPVKWFVETGNIGLSYVDKKYITRLSIRLSMELGANVSVFIQYDSSNIWERKMHIVGTKLKTLTLPVRPKRCDHFKIRIEGIGEVKIYSISKTIEQGSDM